MSLKYIIYCHADKTMSYLEKYFMSCKFKINKIFDLFCRLFYITLMCVPGLITRARIIIGARTLGHYLYYFLILFLMM